MSPQGGIFPFLPCLTVVTKRVRSSGKARRSGVTVPALTILGPWQCEQVWASVRFAQFDLGLIASCGGLLCGGLDRHSDDSGGRDGGEERRRRSGYFLDRVQSEDQFFTANTQSEPPVGTLASRSSPEKIE